MPVRNERLIELLRQVNQGIGNLIKDLLAERDLQMIMMMMARHIEVEPGITVSELARRTRIAKSHISNTIRELEVRGWVERQGDEADQRLVRLYLTPTAVEELLAIKKNITERLNELAAGVSEDQVQELIKGLENIKRAIDSFPGTAAPDGERCSCGSMPARG